MPGLVTPELLDALAFVESSNNPMAVNKTSGAKGLYQFMPIRWKDVQQNNKALAGYGYDQYAHDPKVSRQFAEALLQLNEKRLGGQANLENLLASYNWGIGNVKKQTLSKAPSETQAYIKKVYKQLGRK
jgi:soluble lytic murein transglycosylase-like protein